MYTTNRQIPSMHRSRTINLKFFFNNIWFIAAAILTAIVKWKEQPKNKKMKNEAHHIEMLIFENE